MYNRLIHYTVALFFFLVFAPPVFAAFSLSISSINPDSISSNEQEVTVNVNINDLPSESYFRIAWQESSGNSYFGYMKNNNDDWVKVESGQDCKNYYKISDLSTTFLVLLTKVGDENIINNGNYLLKVRRYTASCSTYKDSEPVSIQVNLPTPTSAPTPTFTPTSTPTNTPAPTPTRTPTPVPTSLPSSPTSKPPTPTTKPTTAVLAAAKKPTATLMPTEKVLGKEATASPTAKPTDAVKTLGATNNITAKFFMGLGAVLLTLCGILGFRIYKERKDKEIV